ncbi:HEAT repeat domain-containing protein [Thermomonospora catenispora]|uniref:HEAT repeat domain-containing protein n=1 Tax=Thermomonospora catenispora TaxID=2493090 RepID=UPI0013762CB8|nr:HEAT repeat domain-containing protein [Thermomonospora catenispora]
MPEPHVARALERMRSQDPAEREKGFDFLREHADSYVEDLIAAFTGEEDPDFRRLLLELIAEARDPKALPVFTRHLDDCDDPLQFWAVRGLEMLDTPDAHRALAQARAQGLIV